MDRGYIVCRRLRGVAEDMLWWRRSGEGLGEGTEKESENRCGERHDRRDNLKDLERRQRISRNEGRLIPRKIGT